MTPVAYRCPCCGDDVIDTGPVCGDCREAGCEMTTDGSGDTDYWRCQRDPGHDHGASEAEAERLGAEHGSAAASWVFDGGTGLVTYRGVLAGIENGDPAVLDSLPGPDLSGQWADGYSSTDLERDTESCDDCAGDVALAYESAYRKAVEAEITRVCRYQLGLSQAS